jgi:hypothetical protein
MLHFEKTPTSLTDADERKDGVFKILLSIIPSPSIQVAYILMRTKNREGFKPVTLHALATGVRWERKAVRSVSACTTAIL